MKILLTGANGYIGMRLLPALLDEGHEVICCVRDPQRFPITPEDNPGLSVVTGDFLKEDSLVDLPEEIDAAYYLIHSMNDRMGNFESLESTTAENFKNYVGRTKAKQIIYLSGIVNDEDEMSEHLKSRLNVENILRSGSVDVTVLRAGIIVGSGSASFEIIRDLVEKLPVMVAPKWLKSKCQPIAIRNVIALLKGVLDNDAARNETFDIGGPDILTYKEMLLQFAEARGLKRTIITIPVLTPRLSSLWLYFVTATSYNLARNLVDSMKIDVVARDNRIRDIIDLEEISYKGAVKLAFEKIAQNLVLSSWKDAVSASGAKVLKTENFIKVPEYGCFKDIKTRVIPSGEEDRVLENIWMIGGERGWYYGTILWKIRGYMDKFVGGIGLRRGRRSPSEIFPGDALDFWRVIVASKKQRRLLLHAEMKLPGEAWLEFRMDKNDSGDLVLTQTATFRPKGLLGRLYWYSVWPFHIFVFSGMISRIKSFHKKPASVTA